MNLPVVVVMTSATCGHCIHMRGEDGDFMPSNSPPTIKKDSGNGWSWNETFFKTLLRAGADSGRAKCRVFEIHYQTMQAFYDNIISFTEFELADKEEVSKNTYYTQNNKLMNTYVIGYRTKSNLPEPTEVTDISFSDLIRKYIPTQIVNYARAYPSWFFCNGEVWNASLHDNTPLFGYLASAKVIKLPNGEFGVDKSVNFGDAEDPVTVINKIVNGKLSLDYTQLKSDTIINNNNLSQPPTLPGFILLPKNEI